MKVHETKIRVCSQGEVASPQLPSTWPSDELPDAEALVSLTFKLLFPDTFQHILPVHKHKVCWPGPKLCHCTCAVARGFDLPSDIPMPFTGNMAEEDSAQVQEACMS